MLNSRGKWPQMLREAPILYFQCKEISRHNFKKKSKLLFYYKAKGHLTSPHNNEANENHKNNTVHK